ncbi:MAG: hypothetical protein ACI9BD_000847 [Candidatus Marinamargulisbacteria bacterium]
MHTENISEAKQVRRPSAHLNLEGSCLCGQITYTYNGPVGKIIHCHCSLCRKWHGSAFRSRVTILKEHFDVTKGDLDISFYDSSETITKAFCLLCGSHLVSYYKNKESVLGLPIGGVKGNLSDLEQLHIFVGSKANWHEITDAFPQYRKLPEDPSVIHQV